MPIQRRAPSLPVQRRQTVQQRPRETQRLDTGEGCPTDDLIVVADGFECKTIDFACEPGRAIGNVCFGAKGSVTGANAGGRCVRWRANR